MTMHIVPPPSEPPPAPAPIKHRTITLTNRAPIRIVEDDWPVIAEGGCGYEPDGAPFGWSIELRVRQRKLPEGRRFFTDVEDTYIVHAKYSYFDEVSYEPEGQRVRVGRMLTAREGAAALWKHILETGEELRTRIADDKHKQHVVYAVDQCFANLTPHNV